MFPMSKLILPLFVAVLFACNGLINLRMYYRKDRSKPVFLYLGVWMLCVAPFSVSAGIADFNDSIPVRFGALNHQVQELKQELVRKQSEGTGDPQALEKAAEGIRKMKSELAAQKMSEPILPRVPWNAVTVATLIFLPVVPGGIYLVRSRRHRRTSGNGLSDQPNP
jgi:hypothetical protein